MRKFERHICIVTSLLLLQQKWCNSARLHHCYRYITFTAESRNNCVDAFRFLNWGHTHSIAFCGHKGSVSSIRRGKKQIPFQSIKRSINSVRDLILENQDPSAPCIGAMENDRKQGTAYDNVPTTTALDPQEIPIERLVKNVGSALKIRQIKEVTCQSCELLAFCLPSMLNTTCEWVKQSNFISFADNEEYAFVKNVDHQCLDDILQETIRSFEFSAKLGRYVYSRLNSGMKFRYAAAVGMGHPSQLRNAKLSKVGAAVASLIRSIRVSTVGIVLPAYLHNREIQCFLEGLLIELCPDMRFKSEETITKVVELKEITIFVKDVFACGNTFDAAQIFAEATNYALQLVNTPPNFCNTCTLANSIVAMAVQYGLQSKVLNLADIENLNMGCYLAVAKGSMYPPKFIHLTYTGGGSIKTRIALIGKGLCFDSGGYNVKNSGSLIDKMRIDMGGAAAVFGCAMVIGSLKPRNIQVHFISALAENMIADHAYRPGDIVRASNGKTVEIGNTDAEGRLTLADALVYAGKLNVDLIVDMATLTGACAVGLGDHYGGLMSSDDQLAAEILESAEEAGEYLWRLPLFTEYRELLDSKFADMNNVSGGRHGGAIIAAVFLKEFVDKQIPWAHIDMAGPVMTPKDYLATGYGVRLLSQFVLNKSTA